MASNIGVKDASAATITMKTTDNAGVHTSHVNVDAIIPGTGATNLGKAEDAAHASGDTGVMALAVRRDTLAASSGSTGDYEPLQTDANGQLRIVPEVKLQATTSGGATPYKRISAGTTDAANVKASAGQVYGVHVENSGASACYLKLYDKATAPTVGTDVPVAVYRVGAGSSRDIIAPNGMAFTLGIGIGIVTGITDSNTTSVNANEVMVNIEYK